MKRQVQILLASLVVLAAVCVLLLCQSTTPLFGTETVEQKNTVAG